MEVPLQFKWDFGPEEYSSDEEEPVSDHEEGKGLQALANAAASIEGMEWKSSSFVAEACTCLDSVSAPIKNTSPSLQGLANAATFIDEPEWESSSFVAEACRVLDSVSTPIKNTSCAPPIVPPGPRPLPPPPRALYSPLSPSQHHHQSNDTVMLKSPGMPSAEQLAQMFYYNKGGVPWTEAEFKGNSKASENNQDYEKRKDTTFQFFLDTLKEHGGEHFQRLVEPHDSGFGYEPLLIDFLRSSKKKEIQIRILDEALKIYVRRLKMKDGKDYKPGSMHTHLKRIFAILKKKYRIDIGMDDFDATGSFRAVASQKWTENQEKDPTFGIKKGKSPIYLKDVVPVNAKIMDGTLKPFEDAVHLKLVVIFILLRLFGLRRSDAYGITRNNVQFLTFDCGPDVGKRYCLITVPFSKTRKLKIGQLDVPAWYGKVKVRDNPDEKGYFNAFRIIEFYVSKLLPTRSWYVQASARFHITYNCPITVECGCWNCRVANTLEACNNDLPPIFNFHLLKTGFASFLAFQKT